MKKALILTLLVLALPFLMPQVQAIEVEVQPIVDRIPPQGIASYNITITNPESRDISVSWSLSPAQATNWIISPNSVSVPALDSRSFTLTAIPKSVVIPSQYNLLFDFRYLGISQEIRIPARVVSVDSVFGFQPHISLVLEHDRQADPRQPYRVSVTVINQNPRNLENLQIRLESPLFSREFDLNVSPSGQITREVQFEIDPLQEPGTYQLYARAFYPVTNTVLNDKSSNFEVISYSDIMPRFESKTSWFKTTQTITIINNGNVARTKEVALKAPFYQRLFLSSSQEYEIVSIDGSANVQWAPFLQPAEQIDIIVTKNYRPLVIVILLLLVGTVLYFVLRSPLVVQKHAFVIKQLEEGVSDIKIRLYVKNRSKKVIYNINISDMIPRITEFVPSNQLGSLKPTKVTNTSKKGTILNWNFESLDALEERIVTYKIRSTLRIVGDLSLPKARVKFENSEGKESFVDSSTAKFFSKQ
ncbi:MAG: hypothetical protein ACMXX9_03800 [Candidatus Woesearchaeota archaeon]